MGDRQVIIIFNMTCVMFKEIPGSMGEQRRGILGCVQGILSKVRCVKAET